MSNIKLLNGDSYKLIKDIPDKSVDLVYIDIPYLYDSGGSVGEDKSAVSQRKFVIEYFKESYDVLGIDYKTKQESLF